MEIRNLIKIDNLLLHKFLHIQHTPRNSHKDAFLQDNYVDVTWDVSLSLSTNNNNMTRLKIFDARPFSDMQTHIQSRS